MKENKNMFSPESIFIARMIDSVLHKYLFPQIKMW